MKCTNTTTTTIIMPTENTPTPGKAGHPSGATPPDLQSEFEREFIRQQQRYETLRYGLSATLLIACPALALLPPRKLDLYTFGLGSVWLYCLSEVSSTYGRDMLHGFQRREDVVLKLAQKPEVNGTKVGGWRGDKLIQEYRQSEPEASSYGSLIMERIWNLWEQRDSNQKDKENGAEVNVREEVIKQLQEKKDARDQDRKQ